MSRPNCIAQAVLLSCCLFAACSPNKGTAVTGGDKAPAAKPKFDFGNVAISPNTGKGKDVTFHLGASGGSQKPTFLGLLINNAQSGAGACYVIHNFATDDAVLVNDSGAGAVALEGRKSIANHQCEVILDGTTSSTDAAGVNVAFHIRFLPGFTGVKHMWGAPGDSQSNGPDMTPLGDWTVQ